MSREDKSPISEDFKKVKLSQNALNCLLVLEKNDLKTPENTEKVILITFSPQALFRLWVTMHNHHYDACDYPPLIQTRIPAIF
jgi:hypothetical protein